MARPSCTRSSSGRRSSSSRGCSSSRRARRAGFSSVASSKAIQAGCLHKSATSTTGSGAGSEKVPLHLLSEILARTRIGKAQPILIDQHRLMLEPLRPCLFGDVLVDPLAELARVWREIQPFGLAAELDAVNRACHGRSLRNKQDAEIIARRIGFGREPFR